MERLTKQQAAIIGAFTGIACGPFSDIQELAENVLNRQSMAHEFADPELWKELKEAVRPQFMELCHIRKAG